MAPEGVGSGRPGRAPLFFIQPPRANKRRVEVGDLAVMNATWLVAGVYGVLRSK